MNLTNNIQLIGVLDGLPIYRTTPNGQDLTIFFLLTPRKTTKTGGSKILDRHRCIAWGELALQLHQHLQANSRIAVRGELHYRQSTTDRAATTLTEIEVADFSLLGSSTPAPRPTTTSQLYPLADEEIAIAAE